MIIYEAIKSEFLQDVFEDKLIDNIVNNYAEKVGRINKSELRSWDNSMKYMHLVLLDKEIPDDAGVAIEFKIPYTSKRVDFLISGSNDTNESIVIVELKQWQDIEKVDGKEAIVKTFLGGGVRETTHPSYQAWSYAALIEDYNENVQDNQMELYPCAYLHNYIKVDDDPIIDEGYQYYVEKAPVFRKGDAAKLREFIKAHIKFGDNKENLYKIENGRIRPSKSLQDSLLNMLKGNQEFVMIDDQKVVYEAAKMLAKEAQRTNKKQVLIVKGGPGTGKSVLAINLLVELTAQNMVCQYVTKNAAPRAIYAKKLKKDFRKGHIDNLFKGSGSYIDVPENTFDVLIVDEAHRLNEKSGMFNHLGENQMKEIISASNFSIFFIDERQRVTLKDAGSIETIQQFADQYNASVSTALLDSQFRCNGSDGYLAWIDDVLQIRKTANESYIGSNYDFRVYSDPAEMRDEIIRLNKVNNKARLLAGYCWDWKKEGKNNSQIHDIELSDQFSMSWNLGNSDSWAIDENSVQEVGCIHTSQGLEFDYVGVIIGDDMYFSEERIQTDFTKRAKTDSSLKGIKKLSKEEPEKAMQLADEIIRNTYRTLLTRGQKGCFVYCTNKDLENYLRKRLMEIQVQYQPNEFFEGKTSVAEDPESYEL
ncbi:DNA/RNA helicase domain-containing protein [Peribacillus sp. NPDC097264]|uniref:DNA/RNA helicase domain-containing protein n=1 Tax=Peribacillus sp. NPDC097264 TaxID=3390616 RepID=UPI003D089739